jgi:hypothetical protein
MLSRSETTGELHLGWEDKSTCVCQEWGISTLLTGGQDSLTVVLVRSTTGCRWQTSWMHGRAFRTMPSVLHNRGGTNRGSSGEKQLRSPSFSANLWSWDQVQGRLSSTITGITDIDRCDRDSVSGADLDRRASPALCNHACQWHIYRSIFKSLRQMVRAI